MVVPNWTFKVSLNVKGINYVTEYFIIMTVSMEEIKKNICFWEECFLPIRNKTEITQFIQIKTIRNNPHTLHKVSSYII